MLGRCNPPTVWVNSDGEGQVLCVAVIYVRAYGPCSCTTDEARRKIGKQEYCRFKAMGGERRGRKRGVKGKRGGRRRGEEVRGGERRKMKRGGKERRVEEEVERR